MHPAARHDLPADLLELAWHPRGRELLIVSDAHGLLHLDPGCGGELTGSHTSFMSSRMATLAELSGACDRCSQPGRRLGALAEVDGPCTGVAVLGATLHDLLLQPALRTLTQTCAPTPSTAAHVAVGEAWLMLVCQQVAEAMDGAPGLHGVEVTRRTAPRTGAVAAWLQTAGLLWEPGREASTYRQLEEAVAAAATLR